MKNRILLFSLFILGMSIFNPVFSEEEERNVSTFSEISLRIPAKLYLVQGKKQKVEIIAKSSTLEEIITEVKGRTLSIKFPNTNLFRRNFNPGKIEIHVTVPEIDKLSLSGSGDIISEEIETRILDLAVSGSGDILIEKLKSNRVNSSISGSGDITIEKGAVAEELSASISGSGNLKASGFEANNVVVRISGSGNCYVLSNGSIKARVAGSGNVNYRGNPNIDSSVAGSGTIKKM